MSLPEKYYYTDEHVWLNIEEDVVRIGVTDFAQDELGDVVFAEISEVGEKIKANDTFGNVESVKTVSELYAPIDGSIVKVNEDLEDQPELINLSPYDKGWLIVIKPNDVADVKKLMTRDAYADFLRGISEEHVTLNLSQINDIDLSK